MNGPPPLGGPIQRIDYNQSSAKYVSSVYSCTSVERVVGNAKSQQPRAESQVPRGPRAGTWKPGVEMRCRGYRPAELA